MHPCKIIERNESENLWFWDGGNAYYFPSGWYDEFTIANGSGLDPGGWDANEIYGYAPTEPRPNSPVSEMWVSLHALSEMELVDEKVARAKHLKLAKYLDEINNG